MTKKKPPRRNPQRGDLHFIKVGEEPPLPQVGAGARGKGKLIDTKRQAEPWRTTPSKTTKRRKPTPRHRRHK